MLRRAIAQNIDALDDGWLTFKKHRLGSVVYNERFPPTRYALFTRDYLFAPLRQRGIVGLKEIGTVHHLFPDILLCASVAIPGVVYVATAEPEYIWLRVVVCVESLVCGTISTLADGMLLYQSTDKNNRIGLIGYDRVTSITHVLTLAIIALYRTLSLFISYRQFIMGLMIGIVSLFFFHRRLYFSYVEQNWANARFCARVWHVGGIISSLIILAPSFC